MTETDESVNICDSDSMDEPSTIHLRLNMLRQLKTHYRDLQTKADVAKDIHDRYEANLHQDMQDLGMESAKYDGVRYDRKSTIYSTMQDREAFIAWAEEQGLAEEFLRQQEAKGRVNELVRACLDNAEELPPGVGFYSKDYIAITA